MDEKQYTVGPLTLAYVFERANLQNLSDMQAVLDVMEAALCDERQRAFEAGFEAGEEYTHECEYHTPSKAVGVDDAWIAFNGESP